MPVASVLVGVTGGIAAYKACELVRLLVKAGHDVVPLVTDGADRFVRRETFFALARRQPRRGSLPAPDRADLYVIAPLTANTLAKLAHGLADNLVTEAALAHRGPLLVAPAMNPRMWAHPATQANVATLRARGVELVGPDEGEMAEGEWGVGRMTEPEEIFAACAALLSRSATSCSAARPRAAPAAPASRSTTCASSATARPAGWASRSREEARRRGADVTLVAANLAVPRRPAASRSSRRRPRRDVEREVLARADADVVVMAAAVADYRPAEASPASGQGRASLDARARADDRRPRKPRRARGRNGVLVGFAAESGGGDRARRRKLTDKNVNLVVFNDVSRRTSASTRTRTR